MYPVDNDDVRTDRETGLTSKAKQMQHDEPKRKDRGKHRMVRQKQDKSKERNESRQPLQPKQPFNQLCILLNHGSKHANQIKLNNNLKIL